MLDIEKTIQNNNNVMLKQLNACQPKLYEIIEDRASKSPKELPDAALSCWNHIITATMDTIPGVLPADSPKGAQKIVEQKGSKEVTVCSLNHKLTSPTEVINLRKHVHCLNIVMNNVHLYDDSQVANLAELMLYMILYTTLAFTGKVHYHIYNNVTCDTAKTAFANQFNQKSNQRFILDASKMSGPIAKYYCQVDPKNVDNKSDIHGDKQTFVSYIPSRLVPKWIELLHYDVAGFLGEILFDYPSICITKDVNNGTRLFIGAKQSITNKYPRELRDIGLIYAFTDIISSSALTRVLTAMLYCESPLAKNINPKSLPNIKKAKKFEEKADSIPPTEIAFRYNTKDYLIYIFLSYLYKRDAKSPDSTIITNSYTLKLINYYLKKCCEQLLSHAGKGKGLRLIAKVMKHADSLIINFPRHSILVHNLKKMAKE